VLTDFGRGFALRSCRFRSATYRRRVAELLAAGTYDAVQVEELSTMANLLPGATAVPVVYSAYNVESALAVGMVRGRGGWLGPLARLEERRTREEERNALARSRLCLAVCEEDKGELEALAPSKACPVHVVSNCVGDEVKPSRPVGRSPDGSSEAVCVACFRWGPNIEGARWFLDRVVPLLRRNGTRCAVRFVGSEIDASLAAAIRAAGCAYDADVPATLPYLHRARVAIVPLLSGGGTRLKIVEAWAAGVPVVSTPLGARGLGCRDGVDALLAADAAAFASAVRAVIDDDALYTRLRANGLARAEDLRWEKLAPLLEDLYGSLRRLT
jgi:glycosyltransferase involved in cell wall biosynthesis